MGQLLPFQPEQFQQLVGAFLDPDQNPAEAIDKQQEDQSQGHAPEHHEVSAFGGNLLAKERFAGRIEVRAEEASVQRCAVYQVLLLDDFTAVDHRAGELAAVGHKLLKLGVGVGVLHTAVDRLQLWGFTPLLYPLFAFTIQVVDVLHVVAVQHLERGVHLAEDLSGKPSGAHLL